MNEFKTALYIVAAMALVTGVYIAIDDYMLTKKVLLADIESRKQVQEQNAAVIEACQKELGRKW